MNEKTNVIRKDDFEKYQILLPFPFFAGKRKKQYLCSELEKRHPCFSDEYAFDMKLKKISRKGLFADVLVMNKTRLAEYETKKRFSGTGFFIDENKKRGPGIINHRFFVDKKWKLILWSVAVLMVAAVILSVSLRQARNGSSKISEKEVAEINESLPPSELQPGISEDSVSVTDLFETVQSEKGKISSFEWSINGFTQRVNVSIKGVYPEKFSNYIEDSVLYENDIPQFRLSFTNKDIQTGPVQDADCEPVLSNADFNKLFRETLLKRGASLKEEKAPPYHIEFVCKGGDETKKLFEELAQIIKDDNRVVTFVSLNQTGANELRTGISIEPLLFSGFEGFNLNLISENLNLFIENKNIVKQPSAKTASAVPAVSYEILGEIKRPDMSTVVFYKTAEGKIEKSIKMKE